MAQSEDLTWPPQVKAQDHLAISALWSSMQQLLSGPPEQADMYIRQLTEMLPPLACVPAHDLPGIVRIHLQSAAHLKATMRLLVPEAFEGSDTVDATSLAGFADRLSPSAEPMVLRLIDLQIFHMCRAQDATAHMRMHARLRPDLQSTTGPAAAAIAAAKDAAVAATCMRSAARAAPVQMGWQQQQRQAKQQQQPEQQQQQQQLLL